MNLARWSFLGATLLMLSGAVGSAAAERAKSAAGPELRISTKSTTFRQGEVIPIQLSFTSPLPNRYQINLARYDRSGRMSYEQFVIHPTEGTEDPLSLYFDSIDGFMGGGLTTFKFLSSIPTNISLNLNEWVTFDKPGNYELKVVSRRVDDTQAGGDPYRNTVYLESNSIDLRIVRASPAWQQQQLANILSALGQGRQSENYDPKENYWQALTALRYLGTEAAARALARRLRSDNNNVDFNCMFGLIGSPSRAAGLDEMDNLLEDPDFPVSSIFLSTMAILPLDSSDSPQSLRHQREQSLAALYQRLASAIANKQGKALAVSLNTLMGSGTTSLSAQQTRQLVPELIKSFRLLPLSEQAQWLQYRWDEIKDPSWIPLLREAALRYQDFPEPREMHAYESLQVSGAALVRWYELDPTEARGAVIAEITRPKPRYNANILGILADQTLPGASQVIAQNFLSTDDFEIESNLASLLFRYADRSVMPEVLAKAGELVGDWACEPQNETLAYVLKFDPADARPLIERAIEARGPGHSACRHMVFTDIGKLQPSPILEELAVASLNDPDPQVAMDAATYLGEHGSATAEQALWTRYEQWSQTWAGRESELRFVFGRQNPHVWDAGLGEALGQALATGVGWLADQSVLSRIQELAVGKNMRSEIGRDLQFWSARTLAMNYIPSVPPSFSVAQYNFDSMDALKTKLKEFPRGTRLFLPPASAAASPDELAAIKQILNLARKDGLVVTRTPESGPPPE